MIGSMDGGSSNRWFRRLAAAIWVIAATAALAWWVKGDLELVWLIGVAVILGGSLLVGLLSWVLLRNPEETAVATVAAIVLGIALLYIAMETPHGWKIPPSAEQIAAATAIANDTARIEAMARQTTGLPVEIAGALVEARDGWKAKKGFSFRFTRREPTIVLSVTFQAGPSRVLRFDVVQRDGTWEPVVRPDDLARMPEEFLVRAPAFERRLSESPWIEVGGGNPFQVGQLLLVLQARSEADWSFVLYRVGIDGEALRELRRYSGAEIREGLQRRATEAGLGRLRDPVTNFQPTESRTVRFGLEPKFYFNATLDHPRYAWVRMFAHLSDGEVEYQIERAFTHPTRGFVGDRPR